MLNNLPRGKAFEIETLATRENRRQHFMHICSRQDKDSIAWRLLQRLEQGIKGFGGQHVCFVKHVNFVLTGRGRHHNLFTQVTNAVYTTIRGRIDLDNIERIARSNLKALLAFIARLPINRTSAINSFSQETGCTRFARSARARKEISMGKGAITERVFERTNNGFLPYEVTKSL